MIREEAFFQFFFGSRGRREGRKRVMRFSSPRAILLFLGGNDNSFFLLSLSLSLSLSLCAALFFSALLLSYLIFSFLFFSSLLFSTSHCDAQGAHCDTSGAHCDAQSAHCDAHVVCTENAFSDNRRLTITWLARVEWSAPAVGRQRGCRMRRSSDRIFLSGRGERAFRHAVEPRMARPPRRPSVYWPPRTGSQFSSLR